MRAMFGIVSILVVVAVILVWFAQTAPKELERGHEASDQAQTIAGRGADGNSALDSVKFEPKVQGSQLKSLEVTEVTPGGAMEQHYGIRKGDLVVEIGELGVETYMDGKMAEAEVLEAFRAGKPLVVIRDGKRVTLSPAGGSVQNQINSIKIPGQSQ